MSLCKYTPDKVVFLYEKEAWIKAWKVYKATRVNQSPYLCKCGYYHLTTKIPKIIPVWLTDFIQKEVGIK